VNLIEIEQFKPFFSAFSALKGAQFISTVAKLRALFASAIFAILKKNSNML